MEKNEINIGNLTDEQLGPLYGWIINNEVTDIDYNGSEIWIRDIFNRKKQIYDTELTPQWFETFAQRIADVVSKPFDKVNNVLEAQAADLRITCVHESVTNTGLAVCIRKTSTTPRITYESAVEEKYAPRGAIDLLINCILSRMNIIICGEVGVGKTEFAKFLCQFIPDDTKVVTIEDQAEWHYKTLKPRADCIELITTDGFDYSTAIKTCLRLNAGRMMLSEVRSVEAVHLIECWSTGIKGVTTLHADDVRKIPNRILNMMPKLDADRLENTIYDNLDVGILIKMRTDDEGKSHRYIDQVGFYEHDGSQHNLCHIIMYNGEIVEYNPPLSKQDIMSKSGIENYFNCPQARKGTIYEQNE